MARSHAGRPTRRMPGPRALSEQSTHAWDETQREHSVQGGHWPAGSRAGWAVPPKRAWAAHQGGPLQTGRPAVAGAACSSEPRVSTPSAEGQHPVHGPHSARHFHPVRAPERGEPQQPGGQPSGYAIPGTPRCGSRAAKRTCQRQPETRRRRESMCAPRPGGAHRTKGRGYGSSRSAGLALGGRRPRARGAPAPRSLLGRLSRPHRA